MIWAFIVCIIIATLSILELILPLFVYHSKEERIAAIDPMFFVALFSAIIMAIISFIEYRNNIVNTAIEHYINGDYQIVEKTINGEIIDSYYKLIPTDYD